MPELLNQAGIRKRIKEKNFACAATAMERFDEILASIVDEAIIRAKKNGRKTVMLQDI